MKGRASLICDSQPHGVANANKVISFCTLVLCVYSIDPSDLSLLFRIGHEDPILNVEWVPLGTLPQTVIGRA